MVDLKRTVLVRPVQARKMGAVNGKYFNTKFNEYAMKELKRLGYKPPVGGKARYAIVGHINAFSHTRNTVSVNLWCNAEENGKMMHLWGTTKSPGSVPDVKTGKDMMWALDGLAAAFAPKVIAKFKIRFQ